MTSSSRQAARRKARVKALQGLYQWDLNEAAGNQPNAAQIREQFHESQDMAGVDPDYFKELLGETVENLQQLDQSLQASLDRQIGDLDPIERSICRLGAYELTHRLDVPLRVVINEWVEISKRFGSDKGFKYINGVMDKLGLSIREIESNALRQQKSSQTSSQKVGGDKK